MELKSKLSLKPKVRVSLTLSQLLVLVNLSQVVFVVCFLVKSQLNFSQVLVNSLLGVSEISIKFLEKI